MGGIANPELNGLEMELLFLLNFSLHVQREVYDGYIETLRRRQARPYSHVNTASITPLLSHQHLLPYSPPGVALYRFSQRRARLTAPRARGPARIGPRAQAEAGMCGYPLTAARGAQAALREAATTRKLAALKLVDGPRRGAAAVQPRPVPAM